MENENALYLSPSRIETASAHVKDGLFLASFSDWNSSIDAFGSEDNVLALYKDNQLIIFCGTKHVRYSCIIYIIGLFLLKMGKLVVKRY